RISDGGTRRVVDDHVGGVIGEFFRAGGGLVDPARAAGDEFYAGEAEVPAVLAFAFFHEVGVEDELELLDLRAVEEEFRGAKQSFAAIDLDESAAGFCAVSRWGGGEEKNRKGCGHAPPCGIGSAGTRTQDQRIKS